MYIKGRDLYVADPTNGSGTFQITVPGGATLTVPHNGGAMVHLTLPTAIARRRAAR